LIKFKNIFLRKYKRKTNIQMTKIKCLFTLILFIVMNSLILYTIKNYDTPLDRSHKGKKD